jgi:uncharacterized protein (TIGR03437 family)
MKKRCLALVCSLFSASAWSKPPASTCGTHGEISREQIFLHARHAAARSKLALPKSSSAAASRDIGEIVVMDDSDGVIGRRNPFNLDRRTLIFRPVNAQASRYRYELAADTFDTVAGTGGTRLDGLGDDDSRQVTLPFAFPFYGASYQSLFVNSDGNLTFTAGDADNTSRSLGNLTGGVPRIAALYTDLDPSVALNGVRVLADSTRIVITWASVPLYSDFGGGPVQNFQVRLFPDGRIEIAWRGVNPLSAVVGIAPGLAQGSSSIVDFSTVSSAEYSAAVAENFAGFDEVDIVIAAQRFYETHEDAYDYLVIYNSLNIDAGPSSVAYEVTVRNNRNGYGDSTVDFGATYGSKRRLQAVLNLGPLSQYPENPNAIVPSRSISRDTPLTVLGHEAGHLFLAFASVREATDPEARPMLGRSNVHWAFTYNSDASLLEGNRIVDNGPGVSPRFRTTATVEGYSALDQYLMGFRAAEEVPPGFVVTSASVSAARSPQAGVGFEGTRRDFAIDEIVQAEGRRTPDHTVSQRRFRFAFILVAAAGTTPTQSDLAKIDRYRAEFEAFYLRATSNRAIAETALRRAVQLSASPALGVISGLSATASLAIDKPSSNPLSFTLRSASGLVNLPAELVIPAGSSRTVFTITGVRPGVDEITATPSDASYESVVARIQVAAGPAGLRLNNVSAHPAVTTVRVVDINQLPYPGVRVTAQAVGGSVQPSEAVADENGIATFNWTGSYLKTTLAGAPNAISYVTPFGRPVIAEGGIVSAASLTTGIAPGSFASIFGLSLGAGSTATATLPFPKRLAGVEVIVNGTPSVISFVRDDQINFVVPPEAGTGPAEILVFTPIGVATARLTLNPVAPGIFFDFDTGLAKVRRVGNFLELYCTGLGATARIDGLDRTIEQPRVRLAGVDAEVTFSGLNPVYPGLYQVNLRIPDTLPPGRYPLELTIGGIGANVVPVEIR